MRKKIGLVSQEPTLFRVSVLENVRYGRLDATDEECIEAAREANIMKFFTKERMNEVIGEIKKMIMLVLKRIRYQVEKNKDLLLQELF